MIRWLALSMLAVVAVGCQSTEAPRVVFGPQNGIEDLRGFLLMGTVENISDAPIAGLKVVMEFKNKAGAVVIRRESACSPDPLPPGKEARYEIKFDKRPTGYDMTATVTWKDPGD